MGTRWHKEISLSCPEQTAIFSYENISAWVRPRRWLLGSFRHYSWSGSHMPSESLAHQGGGVKDYNLQYFIKYFIKKWKQFKQGRGEGGGGNPKRSKVINEFGFSIWSYKSWCLLIVLFSMIQSVSRLGFILFNLTLVSSV